MNSPKVMHQWFMYLFEQQMNLAGFVYCFECGNALHEDSYKDVSTCYSHILSKKQHPEYAGEEWNISIVCPDCHNLYEMKPQQAKKQYAKKMKLLKKLGLE